MTKIKFSRVNPADDCDYIFIDDRYNEYHLYSDFRNGEIEGVDPGFWEHFYTAKSIEILYINENDSRIIRKVTHIR
ncbi:hypothetical protein RN22_09010 [Grimontia sp. AD028]|nr:hypothetical protein RN22_09010 [Grimontia sp. AD028]